MMIIFSFIFICSCFVFALATRPQMAFSAITITRRCSRCMSVTPSKFKAKSCKNVPDGFLLGCEVVNYFNHIYFLALLCIAL